MVRFLQNQMVQEIDELDPNTSILDYLREHLRLCGTKDGCASGDCGACTVVIGELAQKEICYKAINACILPVATLQGKQLITVEDMRQGDALHPVQQAIVEQHASQCGFCTPGFVMSMFALQKNKSQPEREDIIDALGGNLCRCTGYRPLVDAALNMSHKGVDDQFSRYEQSTVASLEAINRSTDSVTLRGNGKQYFSPKNADELAQLLLQYPQARIMAGGTDLGLEITQELRDLEVIIYVGQVKELLIISESEGILEIGAAVSLTDCREALLGQYPNLRDLLERFGSLQIRNLATIGGNIANASPIGDMPPVLLGLGASLVLRCGEQRRTVLLEDFFVSYRVTALQPSEFIERILIPKARPGHEFRAYKISKRLSDDTSSTCGAFHLHIEKGIVGHASIAFSGLSETPRRAFHCEQALLHQPWNETTIESAMQALEQDFHPISDFRASSAYRMRVSKNLVKRLYLDIEGGDASLSLSQYPSQESHIVGRELNPVPLTGVIGLDLFHDSAGKHTSGEAVYTDDQLEHLNCLHAYVGLSQIARGQIRKLDLTAVRQAEGVREVLTLDDVPGHWDIGPVFPGDPVLAGREVEYWGQPIFAVAATSQRLARKAARLAQVEYEELEPCLSIKEALKQENFVRPPHVQDTGGVREAIANAPHCLTGELRIGGQDHFYLEGHVSLALPLEGNGMLVYTSSQSPSQVQKCVAQVLAVPMSQVVVEVRRMGGAFGGKETQAAQWACIAALFARKTSRPVKCRLARTEDMIATGKRHPFLAQYRVGFDHGGHITGLDMELSADCGYSPDLSDAVVDRAMLHADNAYFLPKARIVGNRCKTNTVSNTAFRGFGAPQAMVAIEGIIDDISRYLGKDPLEVRKFNLYRQEDGRNITHYGQKVEHIVLPEIISRLEASSRYRDRRKEIEIFHDSQTVFRKGLALTPVKFGISFVTTHLNQAGALVHVYSDGSIHLNHGGTEMGQGLFVKVAQVVAEEFQVDVSTVHVSAARTDKVPNSSPTAASSSSDLYGMAARDAVNKIKTNMKAFATDHFGVAESDVRFEQSQVWAGDHKFTFVEFAHMAYMNRICLSATGYYSTPGLYYDRNTGSGHPFFYYANGAAVSEVLVDVLTGEYRVLRVDVISDVGQSINPALDIGQIEGGFIQGMGWLTTEELVWGENGRLLTISPASYKIPAIADTPPQFNVELFPSSPNPSATIYHSKGVGEPPLMLAISVWSAIRDAVSSLDDYRVSPPLDTPATPERVLWAIQDTLKAGRVRHAPMD